VVVADCLSFLHPPDGLGRVYSTEGIRGLYKGSLLALVGVTNGSIQFAAYEEIKRRRADVKRARLEKRGIQWGPQHEMLVSGLVRSLLKRKGGMGWLILRLASSPTRSTFSLRGRRNSSPSPSRTLIKSSVPGYR
jgi:hypothetical protein